MVRYDSGQNDKTCVSLEWWDMDVVGMMRYVCRRNGGICVSVGILGFTCRRIIVLCVS